MSLRLLAVHAHPDDESSKGAATYAAYAAAGVEVTVVSCTGGERGSVLNERVGDRAWAERDIAGLRHREMQQAQQILGIRHAWLGYLDSGLPDEGDPVPPGSFADLPIDITVQPLIRLIRRTRPQVMVTYDERGGYPHPDHIRAHEVAVRALRDAANPAVHPELGAPWQVEKLYYDRIQNFDRFHTVYQAIAAERGADERIERMLEMFRERPYRVTTQVRCDAFFEQRDAALRSHASQVAPDSMFFFWPNDVQSRVWPYEDFQLVDSRVPTAVPESDLFEGVDDDGFSSEADVRDWNDPRALGAHREESR